MCEHEPFHARIMCMTLHLGVAKYFCTSFICIAPLTTVYDLWSTNEKKTFARENAFNGRSHGTTIGGQFNLFFNSTRFQTSFSCCSCSMQKLHSTFHNFYFCWWFWAEPRRWSNEKKKRSSMQMVRALKFKTHQNILWFCFFFFLFFTPMDSLCHFWYKKRKSSTLHQCSNRTKLRQRETSIFVERR